MFERAEGEYSRMSEIGVCNVRLTKNQYQVLFYHIISTLIDFPELIRFPLYLT